MTTIWSTATAVRQLHGARCGNGIVDAGEQCDDGNPIEGDGCDSNCTIIRCGLVSPQRLLDKPWT